MPRFVNRGASAPHHFIIKISGLDSCLHSVLHNKQPAWTAGLNLALNGPDTLVIVRLSIPRPESAGRFSSGDTRTTILGFYSIHGLVIR